MKKITAAPYIAMSNIERTVLNNFSVHNMGNTMILVVFMYFVYMMK